MYLALFIEETKQDYYRVLKKCSDGWPKKKHHLLPWWNYFFSVIKEAYKELNLKVETHQGHDNKSALIRQIILATTGHFRLTDVHKLVPNVSSQLIKKVLSELEEQRKVTTHGRGPGAYWLVIEDE